MWVRQCHLCLTSDGFGYGVPWPPATWAFTSDKSDSTDNFFGAQMTTGDIHARESLEQTLIEVAVESWRFARVFHRLLEKLDAGEAARYANQVRYFQKRLEDQMEAAGLRFASLDGQPYDIGIAASPLNIGDFSPEEKLLVDYMVEPIVLGPDGVRKAGAVMLRKAYL